MPTDHIIALLIEERNRLEAAIQALRGPVKRRGRPSKSAATAPAAASAPRKRKMSAAGRKAIGDAARKRWAAIKAGKASAPTAKRGKAR